MENFKTRKLDAADYHKAHPKMKALDKVLTDYVVRKTHGTGEVSLTDKDIEEFKIDILNSLFHPPPPQQHEIRK